ncbi:hypothetical protein PVAP13_6KG157606 [Panicum virgatum]|uniref:Uncharacterized protein n=1 Tax=Panicum virgatum TaxID=38727 RepID=A0A8T0RAT4_PANVG|nr:hypothetical protein PVAP13_6KG157606 [Panicum virgatum]
MRTAESPPRRVGVHPFATLSRPLGALSLSIRGWRRDDAHAAIRGGETGGERRGGRRENGAMTFLERETAARATRRKEKNRWAHRRAPVHGVVRAPGARPPATPTPPPACFPLPHVSRRQGERGGGVGG